MLVGLSVHPSVSATYFIDEATDIKGLLQNALQQILALHLFFVSYWRNETPEVEFNLLKAELVLVNYKMIYLSNYMHCDKKCCFKKYLFNTISNHFLFTIVVISEFQIYDLRFNLGHGHLQDKLQSTSACPQLQFEQSPLQVHFTSALLFFPNVGIEIH